MNELTEDQKARMVELRREEMRVAFIAAAIQGLCSAGIIPVDEIPSVSVDVADVTLDEMAQRQKAEA